MVVVKTGESERSMIAVQPEQSGGLALGIARPVQAHLGHLLEIGAGGVDVDAVVGPLGRLQHGVGDALGGFADGAAGKHAVDVGLVKGPGAGAQVDPQHVDRRDDQHPFDQPQLRIVARFDTVQEIGQAGQDEDAVDLVTVQPGHQGDGRMG